MARQATLELLADASKLRSTLGDAGGDADKFSNKFGGIGKAIGGVLAGGAILSFGKDSVAAFTESAQAQSKLELALKNNSATVGVHADEFAKLNTQLAKHTLVDDDVIAATEAQMATFGASKTQIQSMIPTVLDFAAKMGIDAPEAADLFDKASLGSVKALKTLGIEGYKPTGDKANDLANIQGLLAGKVKGAAQAQLDAAGPGAVMKKHMDELQESVGKLLVPALTAASNALSVVIDWLTNMSDPMKIVLGVVGGLVVAVWAFNAAQTAWAAITSAVAVAQGVLNAVMALNPIVLVALAVAGLVAALILAYQHCETFRNIVQTAFGVVLTVVEGVFNWVKDNWPLLLAILTGPIGLAVLAVTKNWDTIKNGFMAVKDWIFDRVGDIVGFFTGMPGRISSVVSGMFDGIKNAFKGVINWIIGGWNSLHFGIPGIDTHIPGVGKIGGFDVGVPQLKFLAAGGIVTKPTLAMLGEAGPEAVVPLGRGGGIGAGPTHVTYNTFTIMALDPRAASDAVMSAIREYEQRSGTSWRN